MKLIIIIGCSAKKKTSETTADQLYISERFVLAKKLAKRHADFWFILSAKHGLLHPDDQVEPYDFSLDSMSTIEKQTWAKKIYKDLMPFLSSAQVVYIGDPTYFEFISEWLTIDSIKCFNPFLRLNSNFRIPWLLQHQTDNSRYKDVNLFYKLVNKLSKGFASVPRFENSTSSGWPNRGLYLFLHPEESRIFSPDSLRIARVGTHAVSAGSKSSLWQRLRTHKGTTEGGNHRSSIFRSHVGGSILRRIKTEIPSWGNDENPDLVIMSKEGEVEKMVTDYLKGMVVLWLAIDDPPSKISDRAYLEQNIIALLSGPFFPLDIAPESWLGFDCPNAAVRQSGLWNVNYTNYDYDPKFLEIFAFYVDVTLKKRKQPAHSVAPKNWYEAVGSGYRQGFLMMS